ncbi:MAG TPA: histidine phosphatase family protein [Candidatus Nanopelagicales bacterium]|nr:histidine phosphatase family protein [Candidatus Nanopelagicales bacterium]
MPTLVLLRHAKSAYPLGVSDHDRPLSERGRRNASTIAAHLREHLTPDRPWEVAVSTATRTQQTWQIVSEGLNTHIEVARQWDDSSLYLADVEQIVEVASCFHGEVGIIVGHNPGLEDLALSLACIKPDVSEAIAAKFPTSAFAVVSIPGAGWEGWFSRGAQCTALITCR